ncbi:DUF2946 family protein [Kerstersia sp.]|uniref:DUF2946 family protein n=1 Tax=Kerstersia sp. TaxID=1930783 RepID=UPI003F8FA166
MDKQVIQAMQRWPDVPAACGWLSLDARGAWRLHEHGDANQGMPGEPIAHDGLRAFIGRNYGHDDQGRWFFQNGPQRVFVTLQAAPYILRWNAAQTQLETHTGQTAGEIRCWWLSSDGWLYAQTASGPAALDGRELEATANRLFLPDGRSLLAHWQAAHYPELSCATPACCLLPALALDHQPPSAPLMGIGAALLPAALGFERAPALPADR